MGILLSLRLVAYLIERYRQNLFIGETRLADFSNIGNSNPRKPTQENVVIRTGVRLGGESAAILAGFNLQYLNSLCSVTFFC
jgi:hypothetical protein